MKIILSKVIATIAFDGDVDDENHSPARSACFICKNAAKTEESKCQDATINRERRKVVKRKRKLKLICR